MDIKKICDSDSFCILPFMHLFVSEYGELFPCCVRPEEEKGIFDEEGRQIKAQSSGWAGNAWNSALLKSIRKDIIAGKKPHYCRQCHKIDELGMVSARQSYNDLYKGEYAEDGCFIAKTKADGSLPLNLKFIDIRLGNICNLACRTCFPQFSKKMISEFREIENNKQAYRQDEINSWFNEDGFWKELLAYSGQLERINMAGGEAFLVKKSFSFLEELVKSNISKNIIISYITNLTFLPEEIFKLWPKFKGVILSMSIDGIGEVNDYIRYPSKWGDIDKNIKIIDARYDELNIVHASIGMVLTVYNALNVVDVFKYAARFKNIFPAPTITMVNSKPHFDVQVLPKEAKEAAIKRISVYIAEIKWEEKNNSFALGQLRGVRRYIKESCWQEGHFRGFIRQTKIMDGYRNQNIENSLPELASYIMDKSSQLT